MTYIITSETELNRVTPPALPLAQEQYTRAFQDQYSNVLRLYFNRLNSLLNQLETSDYSSVQLPNGAFYDDTSTQTAAVINTPYAVRFDTTSLSSDVTVTGSPKNKITIAKEGRYNFQFSLQLSKTTGSAAYIWIWARVNGVDIPSSNTKIAIQGTSAETVAAWNFVLPMHANDYFQLMWATDDTNVVILKEAANAFSPAIPSSIMTVTFVSGLY